MSFSTPFFSSLGPLLFGKTPVSSLAKLKAQLPKLDCISSLREAFGSFCPEGLFRPRARGEASRCRLFSPEVTFWTFLSQVLCPDSSCRDALRRTQAWWMFHRKIQISSDTSAYCQARRRLPLAILQKLNTHLCDRLESNAPQSRLWHQRSVKIVDGTGLSMPDTPSNQGAYPQPCSQKPGCGFPHMKLVGIFSLGSGALVHYAQGTYYDNENQLFITLWPHLAKGDIILADRGFCSYLILGSLQAQEVDSVMRLHGRRKVDFRKGKSLGKDDQLVYWNRPAKRPENFEHHPEKLAALPPTMSVRIIRLRVQIKAFRTRTIDLVSTLLDPVAYPAEEIRKLYAKRWGVELHLRELKTLLCLDVLSCRSQPMIQKELLLHVIAFNLVRSLMQRASICFDLELEQISFKGSLDALNHFAQAIHAAHNKPRLQAQLFTQLLASIAADLLPSRPGRSQPRARKRRPKYYPPLSKPRHNMKIRRRDRSRPKTSLS